MDLGWIILRLKFWFEKKDFGPHLITDLRLLIIWLVLVVWLVTWPIVGVSILVLRQSRLILGVVLRLPEQICP